MTVETVVFDIGRVLLHWDPEGFYDRAMGKVARVRLFQEVPLEQMNLEIDRGAPWHATVEATAAHYRRWGKDILSWRDHWDEMAGPIIPETLDMLRALRERGVPCWALSNFGRETFDHACSIWPELTEFDGMVISGREGVIKPDAEIYALAEDRIGTPPEHLLFIDDRTDNIEAARARGWQGHVFDAPEGLAKRLAAEGLLPDRVPAHG